MRRGSTVRGIVLGTVALLGAVPLMAQISIERQTFEPEVRRPRGQPVIPVYEGWYPNGDGTSTLCFGYFNLNTEESFDIPIGPTNNLRPAAFDGGQPTHFEPVPDPELTAPYRRYWCVFTVRVPADITEDVVWTLAAGGEPLAAPGRLDPLYILEEPASDSRKATAPRLAFGTDTPINQGRAGVRGEPLKTAVDRPLVVTTRVQQVPVDLLTWIGWSKHQGPGEVIFSEPEIVLERPGSASTMVRFSAPGRYVLRVQAINNPESPRNPTGSYEFHCCWTNGYVEVMVEAE